MAFDFLRMAQEGLEQYAVDQPAIVAFDTETTGLAFYDEPFCVTTAWRRPNGELTSHYFELTDFGAVCASAVLVLAPRLIGHNIKFDLQKCILAELIERPTLADRIEDTETLAHLLDEHRRKKLKLLAADLLGLSTDEDAAVKAAKEAVKKEQGLRSINDIGYHLLPREVIVPYALKDAEYTLMLWERLLPELRRYEDLRGLYEREMELLLCLLDMESAGFRVDLDYAKQTAREYGGRILLAEQAIADLVGKPLGKKVKKGEFNPNSPDQLLKEFAVRGIELASTGIEILGKLDDELARQVLALRALTKMHGTYLLPLVKEQRDGIIHPNIRANGTVTGRMSSGKAEA